MHNEYTAIIKKDGDWWIGWIEEISGVNAQEETKEELLISLREPAKDIMELRREEARRQAVSNFEEILLVI
jgi:predicted RNase H-like HicB family nuclease